MHVHPCIRVAAGTLIGLIGAGSTLQAQAPTSAPQPILVKMRGAAQLQGLHDLAGRHGIRFEKLLPKVSIARFTLPSGVQLGPILSRLQSDGAVEFAEPDHLRYATYIPTDPLAGQQWDMGHLGLPVVWDLGKGSSGVVTAVLDTGIDIDHPDLSTQHWINSDEVPNNGRDDDANGYVDDVIGYDFAGDGILPGPGGEDSFPSDDYVGHGTHVSGTIAAAQDNGVGITGEAPGTRIMSVRVLGGVLGSGYSSDIIEGIVYAVDNGAKIINMSLGGTGKSVAEYNALKYAWDRNVFVAAAAGNSGDADNPLEYPAAYVFSTSVGAVDSADTIAPFSTHNAFVEVSAPGVNILSTIPGGTYAGDWSGTSMATPHVAGVAALLYSAYPNIRNWQIRSMLQKAVVDRGALGWDEFYGHGSLRASALPTLPLPSPQVLEILSPPMGATLRPDAVVSLIWNPIVGATSYRLRATLPDGSVVSPAPLTAPYYTHPQAIPAGIYSVTVEAVSSTGSVISADTVRFARQ